MEADALTWAAPSAMFGCEESARKDEDLFYNKKILMIFIIIYFYWDAEVALLIIKVNYYYHIIILVMWAFRQLCQQFLWDDSMDQDENFWKIRG